MISWLIIAWVVGIVTHKLWRVLWRHHQHPVGWHEAFTTEFAPPDPDSRDRRRRRTPSITEVV